MSTIAPSRPSHAGRTVDEEVRVDREEEHLEDRVEGDEAGAVLGVALREIVPHDDHRDAAREADQDQPEHVLGLVAQEDDREAEHQERPDHPVLDQRQREHALVAEDLAELLVADLRERRVHHQDEADGDRDRRRADAHPVERRGESRRREAERDADAHRREDPERQVAVEEREPPGDAVRLRGHGGAT